MTESPSLLSPVHNPASLEKLAYEAIKEAILTFRLKPGESLVESDLAGQLKISKTPVRDALSRLEKEGFIIKYPYKGYTVSEISKQALIEIFEVRASLEGLAASLATEKITQAQIDQAAGWNNEYALALDRGNTALAAQMNRCFHDWIIQSADNQWLVMILSNLESHLQRYRVLSYFQPGRQKKSVAEHHAILDALRQRDGSSAEHAIRTHLLSVQADLIEQNIDELITQVIQGRQTSTHDPQAHE